MAEDNKKKPSVQRISEGQRYKYVGFDVQPGRIKNQFKSDAERRKLVERVREKRNHKSDLGALRDDCTLLEERVSASDRIVLAVACVAMVAALFLHLTFGHFALAPLLREIFDVDPLSAAGVERQTRFIDTLLVQMFPQLTRDRGDGSGGGSAG